MASPIAYGFNVHFFGHMRLEIHYRYPIIAALKLNINMVLIMINT